jgi:hypothetical protein
MAEFSSFKAFGLANLERTLTAVATLAGSIKVSYQAKEGLESFLRAWRGTGLTSAEVLSLGKLSRFLAEKAEQFIFITHYLRHPAVEKAASREGRIAELRATALALLESPEAGVVSDGGEHLSAVFAQIREAYGALYAREHAAHYQARQPPALSRSAQRALEVLRLLSAIEALDRPAGLEAFLSELSEGERTQCKRRLSEELLRSPLCGCGFALGDSPAPARSESPQEAIDRFLLAYCEILGSPRVVESLAARAFALQDVKASSAERLKRLAEILRRGAVSPAELAGAIDEGTASELGRALSGRIPIRSRSLAELNAKLSGRRLPARTILALVTEWLSEASEDALIAVEPDRAGPQAGPQAQQQAQQQVPAPRRSGRFSMAIFSSAPQPSRLCARPRISPRISPRIRPCTRSHRAPPLSMRSPDGRARWRRHFPPRACGKRFWQRIKRISSASFERRGCTPRRFAPRG